MTSGQGGREDNGDRVARGFEALVESEQGAVTPARPAGTGGVPPSIDPRVRQALDVLAAEVRDELEGMRLELQEATDDLVTERQELRAQIAKTVGAANKWFVKARDQLVERLDDIADLAARAERAALAAAGRTGLPTGPGRAARLPKAVELVKRDHTDDNDEIVEWDVEGAPELSFDAGPTFGEGSVAALPPPATVDLAIESDVVDALMEPLRGDIRELQSEVSAMGQAVAELRTEVAALSRRVPARSRRVRLDERDIDVIIEAVLVAMTPPPAPRKAAKKAARTTAR